MSTQHILLKRIKRYEYLIRNFDVDNISENTKIFDGGFHSIFLCTDSKHNVKIIRKKPLHKNVNLDLLKNNEEYSYNMSQIVLNDIFPNFPINLTDDGTYQEYIDIDLFEFVSTRHSKDTFYEEIYNIVMQTIISLVFLNSKQKLIHNDMKSENILIKEFPEKFGVMYEIDDLKFYFYTRILSIITDFDFMKKIECCPSENGFLNMRTLKMNFFTHPSFRQYNLYSKHIHNFNRIIMKDIISFICCLINLLNNIINLHFSVVNKHKKLVETLYKILNCVILFESDDQFLFLKTIKKLFEYNKIEFNRIDDIIYRSY